MSGFEKRLRRRRLLTPAVMSRVQICQCAILIFLSQNGFRLKSAEVANILLSVFY